MKPTISDFTRQFDDQKGISKTIVAFQKVLEPIFEGTPKAEMSTVVIAGFIHKFIEREYSEVVEKESQVKKDLKVVIQENFPHVAEEDIDHWIPVMIQLLREECNNDMDE